MPIQYLGYTPIGYKVIHCDLASGKLPASNLPDWTKLTETSGGSTGIYMFAFDKSTEQSVFVSFKIPHDYDAGTTIYPLIHWYPAANGTANQKVSWGLEYVITNTNAVIGNSTIIYGDTPQLWSAGDSLVAKTHYASKIGSGITMTGIRRGALVAARVFRDAGGTGGTDDLNNDAFAGEIQFIYKADKDALFTNPLA